MFVYFTDRYFQMPFICFLGEPMARYSRPICLWFYLTFSSAQKDFKMNVAELCIIKKFGFTWNNVQTYYLSVILAQVWCIIMYYLQHIPYFVVILRAVKRDQFFTLFKYHGTWNTNSVKWLTHTLHTKSPCNLNWHLHNINWNQSGLGWILVDFIYTFWYSLLSASSILE